jgi:hypothetical protein
MRAHVGHDEGGTYVEWYRWDQRGDDGEVTRWYASTDQCREMAKHAPQRGVEWTKPGPSSKSSLERHETHADCR